MAVTSIWPIKGSVDQVINYARNLEKTTEQVHGELAAIHSIDGVVEYVANDMKTEQRSYVSCLNCRESDAKAQLDTVLMKSEEEKKHHIDFQYLLRGLYVSVNYSNHRGTHR